MTTSLVPDGAGVRQRQHAQRLSRAELGDRELLATVDEATVTATDLVLSGSAVNPLNPVNATSLTWIDAHTAQFNLTGQFNPLGTVNVVAQLRTRSRVSTGARFRATLTTSC